MTTSRPCPAGSRKYTPPRPPVIAVDAPGLRPVRIRLDGDPRTHQPGRNRVELVLGDEKRVVLHRDVEIGGREIQGDPLAVVTGRNIPAGSPTSSPGTPARKRADFSRSRVRTMVWLNSADSGNVSMGIRGASMPHPAGDRHAIPRRRA